MANLDVHTCRLLIAKSCHDWISTYTTNLVPIYCTPNDQLNTKKNLLVVYILVAAAVIEKLARDLSD